MFAFIGCSRLSRVQCLGLALAISMVINLAMAGKLLEAEEKKDKQMAQGQKGHEAENEQAQEEPMCTIRVQKVESVPGKCVRLRGGMSACQSAQYLDPTNGDCASDDGQT